MNVHRAKTEYFIRTFSVSGSTMWNALSEDIINSTSVVCCKRNYVRDHHHTFSASFFTHFSYIQNNKFSSFNICLFCYYMFVCMLYAGPYWKLALSLTMLSRINKGLIIILLLWYIIRLTGVYDDLKYCNMYRGWLLNIKF